MTDPIARDEEIEALKLQVEGLKAECEKYLANIEQRQEDFTIGVNEVVKLRAEKRGIMAELERKSKDLRAWEIDARTAQAALATARAELDALPPTIATVRALALEEAARVALKPQGPPPVWSSSAGHVADQIRALAPLPSTLCAIPVDVLAQARKAIRQVVDDPDTKVALQFGWDLTAALEALDAAK